MLKKIGRYIAKAAPTAIALALVAGFAHATVPDSVGVIHGCYAKKGGALRVIDTDQGQHCGSAGKSLTWNQGGGGPDARVRWTGNLSVNGPVDATTGILTGDTWIQPAGESEIIVPGTVTVDVTGPCNGTTNEVGVLVDGARGDFQVDGDFGSYVGQTVTFPLNGEHGAGTIFEPDASTPRSMTIDWSGDGPSSCATLVGLSIDVNALIR